jgi:hypothetical protein
VLVHTAGRRDAALELRERSREEVRQPKHALGAAVGVGARLER